jgi:hypothetical protein
MHASASQVVIFGYHFYLLMCRYAIKIIDIDVVMKKFMLGARAKGAVSVL